MHTVRDPLATDLHRLQHTAGYPLLTIVLSTTPGAVMAPADRLRLSHLIQTATDRLAAEVPVGWLAELDRQVCDLAAACVAQPMERSLVLFVGADEPEAFRLPDPAIERVVVDPTFATRDIARALSRRPAYRLLALGKARARLFTGSGNHLVEITDGPFPYAEIDQRDRGDRRGHRLEAERAKNDQRNWDRFARRLDDAVTSVSALARLPMILAAAEPMASRYRRLSSVPIADIVPGNHLGMSATRLAELAEPVVMRHLDEMIPAALAELQRAVDRHRAVLTINEVWASARAGDVRVLFVEDGFAFPARISPVDHGLVPADNTTDPDVYDDAVDEIIEAVARTGGRTVFVPGGALSGNRIAAITVGLRGEREVPAWSARLRRGQIGARRRPTEAR